MSTTLDPQPLEGTWEEIVARGSELAGRRVRVIVLPDAPAAPPRTPEELQAALRQWLDQVDRTVPEPQPRRDGQEGEIQDAVGEKLRKQGLELF